MDARIRSRRNPDAGLRVIAIIKMAKGVLLVVIGCAALHLINRDLGEVVRRISVNLRIDPENREVQLLLERVADIDTRALRRFGMLSFLFATDLFVEGIGLWFNQSWAKYLLLVATGVFLPYEGLACVRHFAWNRLLLLLANLAVFAYVAHHVLCRGKRNTAAD